MSIEVIPAGQSVVVTDKDSGWARDAERVKDVLATMSNLIGSAYADTVKTIKDSESDLERSAGLHTMEIVQDVKDAEANLERSGSAQTMNIIQDVKDSEARQTKDRGDKFVNTIQDVKAVHIAVETSKASVIDRVRDAEFELEKSHERTRNQVQQSAHETAVGFKESQSIAYQLAALGEKTAYQNQTQTLLQFKDQALLSERLAAKQELLTEKLALQNELHADKLAAEAARQLAECCCELKQKVDGVKEFIKTNEIESLRAQVMEQKLLNHRFRQFAPVPAGTLVGGADGE